MHNALVLPALGLMKVLPRVPQRQERRELWVTPEIHNALEGGVSGFPDYDADRLTTNFTAGHFITVSLLGDPSRKKPDMERLAGLDEIWVMCFRRPPPGWRLFGRFLSRDLFIGVELRDRHLLAGKKVYEAAANGAILKWETMCSGAQPLRGNAPADYMQGPIRDVDTPLL